LVTLLVHLCMVVSNARLRWRQHLLLLGGSFLLKVVSKSSDDVPSDDITVMMTSCL